MTYLHSACSSYIRIVMAVALFITSVPSAGKASVQLAPPAALDSRLLSDVMRKTTAGSIQAPHEAATSLRVLSAGERRLLAAARRTISSRTGIRFSVRVFDHNRALNVPDSFLIEGNRKKPPIIGISQQLIHGLTEAELVFVLGRQLGLLFNATAEVAREFSAQNERDRDAFLQFADDHEQITADEEGARILVALGYPLSAAVSALDKLQILRPSSLYHLRLAILNDFIERSDKRLIAAELANSQSAQYLFGAGRESSAWNRKAQARNRARDLRELHKKLNELLSRIGDRDAALNWWESHVRRLEIPDLYKQRHPENRAVYCDIVTQIGGISFLIDKTAESIRWHTDQVKHATSQKERDFWIKRLHTELFYRDRLLNLLTLYQQVLDEMYQFTQVFSPVRYASDKTYAKTYPGYYLPGRVIGLFGIEECARYVSAYASGDIVGIPHDAALPTPQQDRHDIGDTPSFGTPGTEPTKDIDTPPVSNPMPKSYWVRIEIMFSWTLQRIVTTWSRLTLIYWRVIKTIKLVMIHTAQTLAPRRLLRIGFLVLPFILLALQPITVGTAAYDKIFTIPAESTETTVPMRAALYMPGAGGHGYVTKSGAAFEPYGTGLYALHRNTDGTVSLQNGGSIATDPNVIATGEYVLVRLANGEEYTLIAHDTGAKVEGSVVDLSFPKTGNPWPAVRAMHRLLEGAQLITEDGRTFYFSTDHDAPVIVEKTVTPITVTVSAPNAAADASTIVFRVVGFLPLVLPFFWSRGTRYDASSNQPGKPTQKEIVLTDKREGVLVKEERGTSEVIVPVLEAVRIITTSQ